MSYEHDSSKTGGDDLFMKRFKLYKRKEPPPDFSDVIDFETLSKDEETVAGEKIVRVKLSAASGGSIDGLHDIENWKAYRIERLPGVTFIQNPFLPVYQRYWVCRCLASYPLRPNVCNLDNDLHTDRGDPGDLWQQAHAHNPNATLSKRDLLYNLRWVTLGYHYDWTKKVYISSHWSPFPADLTDLSECLASLLGYHCYKAEAAIVNYYHADSTLSGHVDRSELDKRAPLVSISFGQPAIFMVGGSTRQVEPIAMLIRSGDIVVLADEARLAYHAVPRVLSSSPTSEAFHSMCRLIDSRCATTCSNEPCASANGVVAKGEEELECKVKPTGVETRGPRVDARGSGQHAEASTAVAAFQTVPELVHSLGDSRPPSATMEEGLCSGRIRYCASTLSKVKEDIYWKPFESYIVSRRINMNVRQVAERGTNMKDFC